MGVYHPRTRAGRRPLGRSPASCPRRRSGAGARTPTAATGGRRSPTTRAPRSRSRPASFATRRPTASWGRRRRCASASPGCRCARSAASCGSTPEAVLNVERHARRARTVWSWRLNVTHAVTHGRVRILDGARVLAEEPLSLDSVRCLPEEPTRPAARHHATRWKLLDDEGRRLVRHTEGVYDLHAACRSPGRARRRRRGSSRRRSDAKATSWPWARARSAKASCSRAYATYADGLGDSPRALAWARRGPSRAWRSSATTRRRAAPLRPRPG